ncbi:hypothetical protein L6V77_35440 [Myxococcota bacterium]|nr:hypothetical protein [Myxococcota bacterium]
MTCGLGLLAQAVVGAATGALQGSVTALWHGQDPAVAALRGATTGALGGVAGTYFGRAHGVLAEELTGTAGALGRAGLNFAADVEADLAVQTALVGFGLQEEVDVGGAFASGAFGTGVRAMHFAAGARHAWRETGGRHEDLGLVTGLGLAAPSQLPNRAAGWRRYQANGGPLSLREWVQARTQLTERLQAVVDAENLKLGADPAGYAARMELLNERQLRAGSKSRWLAKMFYGTALERATMKAIQNDSTLSTMFRHIGGAFQPDFIGLGQYAGLSFDVTTTRAAADHLKRLGYGPGLNILTYHRHRGFDTF